MTNAWQWLNDNGTLLAWLGASSVVMFVGSLLLVPLLIARIPVDYFVDPTRHRRAKNLHPVLYMAVTLTKNLLGVVLIVAGILMLVLPGQGLLTILFGISLSDFPGKYTLERKLIVYPPIFKTVNWLRHRAGKAPLIHPVLFHSPK